MEKSKIGPSDDERKAQARLLFEEGFSAWKGGDKAKAITFYSRSAELDPEGPGTTALKMASDVMDFYDTDQFNP